MTQKVMPVVTANGLDSVTGRSLSLSYYTVPELSALETVAVAAETGCRYVGVRLLSGQPGGSEMPLMTDAALRRRMIASMTNAGIEPLDANTARLVPDTQIDAFAAFLDVAAELGVKHILATVDDPDDQRSADNLSSLCEAAVARALTINLEFVPWLRIASVADAAALVRRCDHPALGIAVDALHVYRSGSSLADIGGLPDSWFRYLQLCDAYRLETAPSRDQLIHEAVKERVLPGEGDIDLCGLLRALPAGLPIALEIPQAALAATMAASERVRRAVKATRNVLENAYPD